MSNKLSRYALLKCAAQSRLASFKLGKISFYFCRGDFLTSTGSFVHLDVQMSPLFKSLVKKQTIYDFFLLHLTAFLRKARSMGHHFDPPIDKNKNLVILLKLSKQLFKRTDRKRLLFYLKELNVFASVRSCNIIGLIVVVMYASYVTQKEKVYKLIKFQRECQTSESLVLF